MEITKRLGRHDPVLLAICLLALGLAQIGWARGGQSADKIVIEKSRRRLTLWQGNQVLKTYRIALGRSPKGKKTRANDNRTPEGFYRVDGRNPHSRYHLALHLSYPNAIDRAEAEQRRQKPGGDIMIHGIRNGLGWLGPLHRTVNWTRGCVAVTDAEIEQIWKLVPDGTPVEIRP